MAATPTYLNAVGVRLQGKAVTTASFGATTAGQRVSGTSGNDALWCVVANTVLAGGQGDDVYNIYNTVPQVIEAAGEGIDTIVSGRALFTLPPTIENLTVVAAGGTGIGNGLDNVLIATGAGAHTLNGGAGNDVLVGSASGTERFLIARGEGSDAVIGFVPGQDTVQLDGFAGVAGLRDFTELRARMRQVGADTVIDLGAGQRLVLRGVAPGQLSARDFALPFSAAGLRQTFGEEFAGTALNASADGGGTTWRTRFEGGEFSGRTAPKAKEAQYYSDPSVGVNPFGVGNGVLTITAAPGANAAGMPYTSGLLTTARSFAQQYGYFEMRAQLPTGQGFWPAFWMLPADGGWPPELDVLEALGQDPGTVYVTAHSQASGAHTATSIAAPVPVDTGSGFHSYGVLWEPDQVRWYFDGNQIASTATPADMRTPMYMLVDLAVGGIGSWPGPADGTSTARMRVDYVRAYATASTVGVSGSAALPDTPSAAGERTMVKLEGYGGTVAATANGAYSVSGGLGGANVSVLDGDHWVMLGGSGNAVTLGRGKSSVSAGSGQAVVRAGGGDDTIRVGGWDNLLDGGGGSNTLIGGAGRDTFVLNAPGNGPGQGFDQVRNFTLAYGDVLDLSRTLSGAAGLLAKDLSNLGAFITARTASEGTTLLVDPTGSGAAPAAFALLQGMATSVAELIGRHALAVDGAAA